MEEGLAKRLNVALGDTVTFMGDTQEFRAKVTSLRKVDWESLRPNFYFIFPEGHRRATAELAYQFPLGEWQRHVDATQPPVPYY